MKVNHRFLYAGVFLLATGGVILVAQGVAVDAAAVAQLLSLWPLAVVAVGVALLLRRTRLATAGGVLAAAVPGLMLGGMVVAIPMLPDACGPAGPAGAATQRGAFAGDATVDLHIVCGELVVTTAPGTSWQLDAGDGTGVRPTVDATPGSLAVRSPLGRRPFGFGRGDDSWRLVLPTGAALDLAAEVDAGHGQLDLAGAHLRAARLAVNAGDLRVDLSRAAVERLSVSVNAGSASVSLGAEQDLEVDLAVNAGALRICAPDGLGLRVRQDGVMAATDFAGLIATGSTWESPDYASATHHADVTIRANVGSVDLNPVGGCQ